MKIWNNGENVPGDVPETIKKAYFEVLPYIMDFLPAKHPHRSGAVCPFAQKALSTSDIFFTFFDTRLSNKDLIYEVESCVEYLDVNKTSPHAAMIILFEKSFDIKRLHRLHISGKVVCIEEGYMLGALYENSPAQSLHSNEFFPLRTPAPVLVIRNMVPSDIIFLEPGHYRWWSKTKFLNSYISKFEGSNSKLVKDNVSHARAKKNGYKFNFIKQAAVLTVALLILSVAVRHI